MPKFLALLLLVVGAALLVMGFGSADSFRDGLSRVFTGHSTERTYLLLAGGVVCIAAGIYGMRRPSRE